MCLQLAAARERAAKAEAERATAARDLARTQALTRLAHAAEQDAIRERRTLRTQKHHVRAERDDLVAKVRAISSMHESTSARTPLRMMHASFCCSMHFNAI